MVINLPHKYTSVKLKYSKYLQIGIDSPVKINNCFKDVY
jgi:hypothetical protein